MHDTLLLHVYSGIYSGEWGQVLVKHIREYNQKKKKNLITE